jgi:RNA polymerase sigma-70 factor (ECF subfamily)
MAKKQEHSSDPAKWTGKYGDYLYGYAISRVYRKELAEDLVQETFLSALKARDSFEGKSKEQTWLTSILRNKIIDHYRKAGNSREKMLLDQNWELSGEESPFQQEGPFKGHWRKDASPGSFGGNIEKMIESEEFQKILEFCLSLLPDKWAAAFTLKILEECESEEICKDLQITSSNLWVILHRARLKIRECLEKKWINE